MRADDRTLLLDLENLGIARRRGRALRRHLGALVGAAGELHHAVAAYAIPAEAGDPAASTLAELGIAPLRVAPARDAAEHALLAHARHVHREGGRTFIVASADGRLTEIADLGRLELLLWEGQPVAARLEAACQALRRVVRPTGTGAPSAPSPASPPGDVDRPAPPRARLNLPLIDRAMTGLAAGLGLALGQWLLDASFRARGGRRARSQTHRDSTR